MDEAGEFLHTVYPRERCGNESLIIEQNLLVEILHTKLLQCSLSIRICLDIQVYHLVGLTDNRIVVLDAVLNREHHIVVRGCECIDVSGLFRKILRNGLKNLRILF